MQTEIWWQKVTYFPNLYKKYNVYVELLVFYNEISIIGDIIKYFL